MLQSKHNKIAKYLKSEKLNSHFFIEIFKNSIQNAKYYAILFITSKTEVQYLESFNFYPLKLNEYIIKPKSF